MKHAQVKFPDAIVQCGHLTGQKARTPMFEWRMSLCEVRDFAIVTSLHAAVSSVLGAPIGVANSLHYLDM